MGMTQRQYDRWCEDRDRQSKQQPDDQRLAEAGWTRGYFFRRKNNGIALRTFLAIVRPMMDGAL